MSQKVVVTIAFLLGMQLAYAQYTTEIVAHWKLDEGSGTTASDSSGNGNNGVLVNGPTWAGGKINGALSFDGSNDEMWWSYTKPQNTFTVSAWIKANTTHEIDGESTSGTGGVSGQKYLFWPNQEGSNGGMGISAGINGISVYEHGDSYMPALAVYSSSLGTGWNHIIVVYENKQPKIYSNGLLVRTGSTSLKSIVYAPTGIGGGVYGHFPGLIDDARVYNRALSAAEIQSIYTEGYGGTIPTLFNNTFASDLRNYRSGWSSAHWIPTINRLWTFGGDSHNSAGNNGVRLFDPVANVWTVAIPNTWGVSGCRNSDNYHSFYVPSLDEVWVMAGQGTSSQVSSSQFLCRYQVQAATWITYQTKELAAAFVDGIDTWVHAENAAVAYSGTLDQALFLGGASHGSPSSILRRIIKNPAGAAKPFRYVQDLYFSGVPTTANSRNRMVAVDRSFYALLGQRLFVSDGATVTELAPAPVGGTLSYDSTRNRLVLFGPWGIASYDLVTQAWTMTAAIPPGQITFANTMGDYSPIVDYALYTGGYAYMDGQPLNDTTTPTGFQAQFRVVGVRTGSSTVTPPPPPPPPPPPSTGVIDIPVNTWIRIPLPGGGTSLTSGKHMRYTWNPVDGRIYHLGGDFYGTSSWPEMYSYGVFNNSWRKEQTMCVTPPDVQHGGADEVTWTYDTRRNIFWMIPGYMSAGTITAQCPAGTLAPVDKIMTWDPATKKWSVPNRTSLTTFGAISAFHKYGHYDSVTDTIVLMDDSAALVYNITSNTWTRSWWAFSDGRTVRVSQEYSVIDSTGRAIYVIDGTASRLYRYGLDSHLLTDLGPTVPGAIAFGGGNTPLSFDPIHRVILWPLSDTNTISVYHVDTATWETMTAANPSGMTPEPSSQTFDPGQNVLFAVDFGLAGGVTGREYLWLYRYSSAPLPPSDTTLSASPTTIISGGSATLTWSSTNATSCTASGAWSGIKSTSGTQIVSPAVTSTYTLTCANSEKSISQTLTLTVNPVVINPGDINGDKIVDILDVVMIVKYFDKTVSDSKADIAPPFGIINIFDIMVVITNWGKRY